MKTLCCLLSYEITRGMKSRGPLGLLKKNNSSDELVLKQIGAFSSSFDHHDTCVVTGFGSDKMLRRLPETTISVVNPDYNTTNQVYALKLLVNQLGHQIKNYSGIFILNSDVIIKNLSNINLDRSCIITKHKHGRTADDYLLGATLDKDKKVHTIFYNVGHVLWCNAVYLCRKDWLTIASNIDHYYDNMFLFELLNKAIDSLRIDIYNHTIKHNTDCIIIKGPKDKYKII